jgi:hypothetical protein
LKPCISSRSLPIATRFKRWCAYAPPSSGLLVASSLGLAAVWYARFYQAEPAPVAGTTKCPEPLCRPSPYGNVGRLPTYVRERNFPRDVFKTAPISLCSSLTVCSPHRSFPPLQLSPQGGRGFYIRAERASLPPHAPDMLSARLQAIGGTRLIPLSRLSPCIAGTSSEKQKGESDCSLRLRLACRARDASEMFTVLYKYNCLVNCLHAENRNVRTGLVLDDTAAQTIGRH